MKEPAWIDERDALALHDRLLALYGGAAGVRDDGLLNPLWHAHSSTLLMRRRLNLFDYRATSRLFYFTGDPSLTSTFDGCITGSSQPAVSDGYWIMLAPLSPGTHTIHFTAGIDNLVLQDVTYHLTVAGSRH